MLPKTDYTTTIDEAINAFIEEYFEKPDSQAISTDEIRIGVLPRLRDVLRSPDPLEALICERAERLLKRRTFWETGASRQADLFGFTQMFILLRGWESGPDGAGPTRGGNGLPRAGN